MVMLVYRDSSMYVYRLLSTDVKPMGCPNDSRAIEIDTGKRYIYDAHNGLWQDAITSFSDEIDIDAYTKEQTQALLDTKVDKVTGMGLSQESFTTTEKEKLASMSVITVDTNPTSGSQNAVSSGGVYTALAGKQDSLTFDNTPTSGSSNPVKSGGVYTALSGKADKTETVSTVTYDTTGAPILKQTINGTTTTIETPDTTPTSGSKHLLTSGGAHTALSAKADATSTAAAIAANTASIATVADAGAKNVLKTLRASGSSMTGLTYTLNSDGTYTLGGTTSADANISGVCTLADIPESYVGKTVKLTGGIDADIRLAVYNGNTQTGYTDNGEGAEFEVTSAMRTTPYTIRLLVRSGTNCSGKVIKPMLRLASIPGDSYQQYAPTNRELYQMVLALQSATSLSMSASPGGSETREILNKTEKSDEVEEPKEVEEFDSIPEPDEKDIRDER